MRHTRQEITGFPSPRIKGETMKIDVVGSMCTWVLDLSTSYIINDEFLFDAPQGSFKTLMNVYDLTKIKYIIVSHFHSDHFMDLHLVLEYIKNHSEIPKIKVIAPKGCRERLLTLFDLIEIGYLRGEIDKKFEFIDAENNKIIKFDGYKIKCFKMTHLNLDSYGFLIEKDGVAVGFSGDTAMCNNVRKIISKSKAIFIDSSNIEPNNKHLSVKEVAALSDEFPSCKFYAVHLSPYSIKELKNTSLYHPKQGEVVIV